MIRIRITVPAKASNRDLRNRFPAVREVVESEGEVLLTESGKVRYRLALYSEPARRKSPTVDFWKRLRSYQPQPLTAGQAEELRAANRGNR